MSVLAHVEKALTALAHVQVFAKSLSESRDEQRITPEKQKLLTTLRHATKNLDQCVSSVKIFDLFKKDDEDLGMSMAAGYPDMVIQQAKATIMLLCTMWTKDLRELVDLLTSWIPAGWQAAKDDMLDPPYMKLVDTLMHNPHYKQLGAAGDMLEKVRLSCKALNGDGAGAVVCPQLLKDASTIVVSATETVLITYCLFHILHVLPKNPNVQKRKDEAAALSKKLQSEHKFELGRTIVDRLNLFIAGRVPAAVLAAPKDAAEAVAAKV